jgi:large subunit ribosomal protein L25
MATQVTLKAGLRDGRGKGPARKLRAQGKLPAVVYGAAGEPLALALDTHETQLLFHSISVDNTIVNLEIEGEGAPVQTLVREIQTHPIRPDILHVDFLRIQMDVEVELEVPLHVHGTPKGVRDEGGVLEQPLHDLPIRCLPDRIPEEILVEVAELGIGDAVHVRDLVLPEGVEVLLDGDRIVCSVQIPTVLKVEEPVAAEAGEPEVVGEKEKAGEEAEGAKEGGRKEGGKED